MNLGVNVGPIALPANAATEPKVGDVMVVTGWGLACKDPPSCNDQSRFPELVQVSFHVKMVVLIVFRFPELVQVSFHVKMVVLICVNY